MVPWYEYHGTRVPRYHLWWYGQYLGTRTMVWWYCGIVELSNCTFSLCTGSRVHNTMVASNSYGRRCVRTDGTIMLSQLSDWKRAHSHVHWENHVCVVGGYTAASWERERMQGHTPTLSLRPSHHCLNGKVYSKTTYKVQYQSTYTCKLWHNIISTYTCTYHGTRVPWYVVTSHFKYVHMYHWYHWYVDRGTYLFQSESCDITL